MVEGLIFALLASLFWGMNGVLLRVGLRNEDVVSATTTIMLVVSLITLLFSAREVGSVELELRKLHYLFMAGFFSYFIARVITYRSVNEVGSSRAFSATSTRILFSAIFGYLLLRESLGTFTVVGTALMVTGLYIFTTERVDRRELYISTSSGVFYGLASLLIKLGIMKSVFVSAFIASISGFAALSTYAYMTGRMKLVRNRFVFLSALSLALGNISYFYSLSTSPLVIAVPLSNLYPLVTTALSYAFIRDLELVGIRTFAGSLLTVIGSVLIFLSTA